MKIEYHPLTASDLNEATQRYNEQRPGLGSDFRAAVDAAIERIRNNPHMYVEVNGIRRALLNRFPYSVVYRLLEDKRVRVLLIRHHKRHPEYGLGRQ